MVDEDFILSQQNHGKKREKCEEKEVFISYQFYDFLFCLFRKLKSIWFSATPGLVPVPIPVKGFLSDTEPLSPLELTKIGL